MRVAFLGPAGTFTEEALLETAPDGAEPVAYPTVYDTVMAVHDGRVERAFVPIENSLEGGVAATLDALATEASDVRIVAEHIHPIHHCLVARRQLALADVQRVISHPQAMSQCAALLRDELGHAARVSSVSTAEAARAVAESGEPWAALASRLAAELYGCVVLRGDVEDSGDNETRFVWLAARTGTDPLVAPDSPGPWKTSLVFWGVGAQEPGWLVRCLSEFAFRGVNLVKIESRPRRSGLGHYVFLVDAEGRADEAAVADAVAALHAHCEDVRLLGSYPAAS